MDRLTHKRENGIRSGYWSPNRKDELVERLAVYENTGLTPDEAVSLNMINMFESSQIEKLMQELADERTDHTWEPIIFSVPNDNRYVLLSMSNCDLVVPGRYVEDESGGAFFLGNDDQPASSKDLFVNAWMELPKPYRGGEDE